MTTTTDSNGDYRSTAWWSAAMWWWWTRPMRLVCLPEQTGSSTDLTLSGDIKPRQGHPGVRRSVSTASPAPP